MLKLANTNERRGQRRLNWGWFVTARPGSTGGLAAGDSILVRLATINTSTFKTRLSTPGYLVSQAYCSALPVSYSSHPAELWEPFARFILEGAYEATLRAAHLNAEQTGNNTVYLTLLGGGAFGNETDWILDSLERVLHVCTPLELDVAVVSYGRSNSDLQPLLKSAS
jgi:hypothetical protein